MFRTVIYIFRQPWGLYRIITEYHDYIVCVKAYVITNWIQDIQNGPAEPHIKKYFLRLIEERSGFALKEDVKK